jgi:homogentisate 1,2-dioxygenase
MAPSLRAFSTQRGTVRVVFGAGTSNRLVAELDALSAPPRRLVVITSPGRRAEAASLASELGTRCAGVVAIAREHIPVEIVAEARAEAAKVEADAIVALGGGSAIGLAKALAVTAERPLPIIALPTTFSGSEMTPIYGITESQKKKVARDERARPALVVYDPALATNLPREVAIASLWNALAHAVEVLWLEAADRATLLAAEEAARLLGASLVRFASRSEDANVRDDAFEGAFLAGGAFADAGGGLHHKICHVLGGSFGLPHALTHATVLPHVTRWMSASAPGAMTALARALGVLDPVLGLERLAAETGIPRSLRALGFPEDGAARLVDEVIAGRPASRRPLERDSLAALVALASTEPKSAPRSTTPLRAPAELKGQPGFGSTHDSEALPGALPRTQNTPRPAPYGLYPDLLSGTPFTVKNAQSSRVWMYRVRPAFSHSAFRRLPASRFCSPLGDVEPTRTRWSPLPIPEGPARVDFLDGLTTLGGDGDSRGPGYVVNLYAANADMIDRAFSTADGDLLIVPQTGTLDVRTELGFLRVPPGTILVVPRGIKFAVGLPDGSARGWMLEVFGPRLRLPERGPIGSNGLADARHFLAPTAAWEDRLCPDGFELVHKLGGNVFSATQAHSPFDVVAWHGVHVPFTYDLMLFNAMGSVTFDHVDPSIHTVLTAPLDDYGRAVVDFVAFRGRWDVAEHSFRPPYMHRNAASEINGVVSVSSTDPSYVPGCTFVSPLLTSHGISTRSYDTMLDMPDEEHEGPHRMPDESLWIMFESALPFRPSEWARTTSLVDKDFLTLFDGMRCRFDPSRP